MLLTSLPGHVQAQQLSIRKSTVRSFQHAALGSSQADKVAYRWHSEFVKAAACSTQTAQCKQWQPESGWCGSLRCRAASADGQAQEIQDAAAVVPSADAHVGQHSSSTSSDGSGSGSSGSSLKDDMSACCADVSVAPLALTAAGAHSSQGQSLQPLIPAAAASPSSSAVAEANTETRAIDRLDIYKAIAVGGAVSVLAGVLDHEWVDAHQGLAMSLLFGLGYVGILVEELVGLNKAGVALLLAVCLWTIRSTAGLPVDQVDAEVAAALASVSELIFFILGAMTIVEVVDVHGGFKRLASWVVAEQRSTLAWGVGLLSFAMSAVLDNLTTTILMLSILSRANPNDAELRKLLGAVVVIAANAGGAWTPIGDVTTTMLWVGGQITPAATMRNLFLPSLVSLAVPLALLCATAPELQGPVARPEAGNSTAGTGSLPSSSSSSSSSGSDSLAADHAEQLALQERQDSHVAASSSSSTASSSGAAGPLQQGQQQQQQQGELLTSNRDLLVLSLGLGALLFVPLFKQFTNLPPYMGMLSGLGVLWMVTDALHFGENRAFPRVQDALRNLDIAGVMFFMGILMSVEALNAAGLLGQLARTLNEAVPNVDIIAASIGLVSALIDNVPLVAATQGMYDVTTVPADSQLWQLIALCAGTGGSLLLIGSAAGVAYMGLEGTGFGWYMRKITPWALLGYTAAITSYVVMHGLPSSAV